MNMFLLWSLLLAVVVLALFVVPLLPALLELRANRAAEPIYINPAGNPLIPESGQKLDANFTDWPAHVEPGTLFYRIQSSYIYFGKGPVPDVSEAAQMQSQAVTPFVNFDETPTHHDDSLRLARGEVLHGSRVVHGNLVMQEGSRILGNVKVRGEVFLGRGCVISGSLFCMQNVKGRERVHLMGPVAVHSHLQLGRQSVLGAAAHPTSVSARTIELGEGSVAHGVVRALLRGRVVQSKWPAKISRSKSAHGLQ